jgi:hypothetical protein
VCDTLTTPRLCQLAKGQGAYMHPHRAKASKPGTHGHGLSGRQTLAHKQWSPASAGWQSQEGDCAPLQRASCPLVRTLALGPSGPSHAVMHDALPQSDSDCPPTSVMAQICLGNWVVCSAALSGSSVSCSEVIQRQYSSSSSAPGDAGV